jgi:hypothetical protein
MHVGEEWGKESYACVYEKIANQLRIKKQLGAPDNLLCKKSLKFAAKSKNMDVCLHAFRYSQELFTGLPVAIECTVEPLVVYSCVRVYLDAVKKSDLEDSQAPRSSESFGCEETCPDSCHTDVPKALH